MYLCGEKAKGETGRPFVQFELDQHDKADPGQFYDGRKELTAEIRPEKVGPKIVGYLPV